MGCISELVPNSFPSLSTAHACLHAATSPAVVQSGDFSGPKPAVQNSDQVTDISFTLNLIGPDTVVSVSLQY